MSEPTDIEILQGLTRILETQSKTLRELLEAIKVLDTRITRLERQAGQIY